jgi:hypothetical protein
MASKLSVKAYLLQALNKNIIYRYYRYEVKPSIKLIKKLKAQLSSTSNFLIFNNVNQVIRTNIFDHIMDRVDQQ